MGEAGAAGAPKPAVAAAKAGTPTVRRLLLSTRLPPPATCDCARLYSLTRHTHFY